MNKKVNVDIETIKLAVSSYRVYAVPVVTIFVCILLLVVIIIPQFGLLSSNREKRDQELRKLDNLRSNLLLIQSINDERLQNDLNILSSALPVNKDFEAILNAISTAANASGVGVGDFGFRVGDITSSADVTSRSRYPSLNLEVNVSGSTESIINFISEVYKTVPLGEVSSVRVSGATATVSLVYYYRPLPPLNTDPATLFRPIEGKDREIIDNLSRFRNSLFFSDPASSSSLVTSDDDIESFEDFGEDAFEEEDQAFFPE